MTDLKSAVLDVIRRLDAKEITRKQALDELCGLGIAPIMALFLTSGRGEA